MTTHPRRLPPLRPDELDPDQAALREQIAGGDRAKDRGAFALVADDGSLTGPFNAMLYAPAVGDALQGLGSAIRYRSSLSDRCREIAILVVATRWRSGFERMAHEAVGRKAGMTEAELAALRDPAPPAPSTFTPVESLVLEVTAALANGTDGDIDDLLWERAEADLGRPALVELTTLVGYYATLALQLRVFRVPGN